MNNKLLYSEAIDNYLDGNITESDRVRFDQDLNKSAKLQAELELERNCRIAISDLDMLDFRSKLMDSQKRYNEVNSQRGRLVKFTRKYWAAAAVILLLLVSGLVFIVQPGQYTSERLFKMYYKTGDAVGISRSGNGNIVEAVIKYHEKDYTAAIKLFDEILQADPSNFAVRYYCGISYIETGNYDNAIKMLESVLEQNDNLYIEYAQWYCSLAYLAKGDNVLAEAGFKAIASNPDHYYKDQAHSILVKMDQGAEGTNFLKKVLFFILPF